MTFNQVVPGSDPGTLSRSFFIVFAKENGFFVYKVGKNETMNLLPITTGMSKEAMIERFVKDLPDLMEESKKDKIDLFTTFNNITDKKKTN